MDSRPVGGSRPFVPAVPVTGNRPQRRSDPARRRRPLSGRQKRCKYFCNSVGKRAGMAIYLVQAETCRGKADEDTARRIRTVAEMSSGSTGNGWNFRRQPFCHPYCQIRSGSTARCWGDIYAKYCLSESLHQGVEYCGDRFLRDLSHPCTAMAYSIRC